MRGGSTLYLDFETRCVLDLKSVGTHRYVADPSFKVLVVNYAFDDGPVISRLDRFVDFLDDSLTAINRVVAHNIQFERAVLRRIARVDKNIDWVCTAARARRCGLPSALKDVAKALRLPVQKDTRGKYLIRKLCRPLADGSFCDDPTLLKELAEYGAIDVEVCRQLDLMLPQLDQIE